MLHYYTVNMYSKDYGYGYGAGTKPAAATTVLLEHDMDVGNGFRLARATIPCKPIVIFYMTSGCIFHF